MNELLLIATLLLTYGSILLTFRYFGGTGLYVMNSVITILVNIEVLVVVNAFGIEQTLGNVLFATTSSSPTSCRRHRARKLPVVPC